MIKVGDVKDAISVFFDDEDFVRDSRYTHNAFDGWDPTNRPLQYFTKHSDYGH